MLPTDPMRVRFLVACPRSGSTLLMRIFAQNEDCAVSSRLVFMGRHGKEANVSPDYSIFYQPSTHLVIMAATAAEKSFLINKDEFGHDMTKGECDYNIFPDLDSRRKVKPAYLFRDPVRIFDSWKELGWDDLQSLQLCFTKLETMSRNQESSHTVLYEELIGNPEETVRSLCKWWDVSFEPGMLRLNKTLDDFFFYSDREREIYCGDQIPGLFDSVKAHSEVMPSLKSHQKLDYQELELVENSMGRQYLRLWGQDFKDIRATLHSKSWFAFDLDDTLHNFRGASGAALSAVLSKINTDHGVEVEEMQKVYRVILTEKTASAFVDGRTSADYRKERFSALMEGFQLKYDILYLKTLANTYKTALAKALRLKCGALPLLKSLKESNKRIAIITEGPEDAQSWTIEQLGIAKYVDFLATTNRFGVSKVDGLLSKVMETLDVPPKDAVFIGDNWSRDILPAIEAGIYAIHYSELENVSLNGTPIRINTLKKLQFMLE